MSNSEEKELIAILTGINDSLCSIKDYTEGIQMNDNEKIELLKKQVKINSERLILEKELKVLITKLLQKLK